MQHEALSIFVEKAKEVAGFKTIEQYKHLFGNDFTKLYNELEKKLNKDGKKLGPNEQKSLDDELINELKKVYIKMVTNYLNSMAEQSPGSQQEINKAVSEIERFA
jgi:hypothetical protein